MAKKLRFLGIGTSAATKRVVAGNTVDREDAVLVMDRIIRKANVLIGMMAVNIAMSIALLILMWGRS